MLAAYPAEDRTQVLAALDPAKVRELLAKLERLRET
jgi:hypothetical protein